MKQKKQIDKTSKEYMIRKNKEVYYIMNWMWMIMLMTLSLVLWLKKFEYKMFWLITSLFILVFIDSLKSSIERREIKIMIKGD